MLGQIGRTFEALRSRSYRWSGAVQEEIRALLEHEADLRQVLLPLRDERIHCTRIRHHGDFQLSHLQFTGSDVMIMDFDGDPSRPMSERRLKRAALRDVASMIRSFSYISYAVLYGQVPGIIAGAESHPQLEKWAEAWRTWMSAIFLRAYLDAAGTADFVPATLKERRILLRACLVEKCLLEINFELEYRPDWLRIPVRGILDRLRQLQEMSEVPAKQGV
jgi:maltose alpha-D-glucosyltransferase/alpha-amylase